MSDLTAGPETSFLTLSESARIIGRYCWVERRLFEILGAWVGIEADAEAKLLFADQSNHHGWHAELWTERLPTARGFEAGELVAAPSPEVEAAFRALRGMTDPEGTTARLRALHEVVLPGLVSAYERHLPAASPVADGPTIRALTLARRDDIDDQIRGRHLLDRWASQAPTHGDEWALLDTALSEMTRSGGLFPEHRGLF